MSLGSEPSFCRSRRTWTVTVAGSCQSEEESHTCSSSWDLENTWPGEEAKKDKSSNSRRVRSTSLAPDRHLTHSVVDGQGAEFEHVIVGLDSRASEH